VNAPITLTIPRPAGAGDSTSVFALLNMEWAAMRMDPAANALATRWAKTEPALTGLTSLVLIEQAKEGPVDARVDALVSTLVTLANATGASAALAARVVLQLMLPKAAQLARTHRQLLPDTDEREQLAVCCMYSAIRTHPAHITTHVPPYLAWGAQRAMRRAVAAQIRELPFDHADDLPLAAPSRNSSEELAQVLAWAVAEQVITQAESDLLIARYGQENRQRPTSWNSLGDLQQLAAATGLTPDAVKKRCSRAGKKLAAAAAGYVGATCQQDLSEP
jgi:hypothetical protein